MDSFQPHEVSPGFRVGAYLEIVVISAGFGTRDVGGFVPSNCVGRINSFALWQSCPTEPVHSSGFIHKSADGTRLWAARPRTLNSLLSLLFLTVRVRFLVGVESYDSHMCSTDVLPADAALNAVQAAVTALAGSRLDTLDTGQRLAALAAITAVDRQLAGVENQLITGLQREATHADLGDGLTSTLARVTRITKAEATRRIRDAEDTATRTAITGEPLPPRFPATAAGVAAGTLDRTHVREIHRFFDKLPANIPADERDRAETFLAEHATRLRPDELRKAADHLLSFMGHDDDYTDTDRARRRGFTWSHQDCDGMSKGVLWATPALRAELDAILAAWAAPGKCNPNDESPCVDGDPDPQIAERDTRAPAQRRHDALSAVARAMLASGQLGQHNGLPVTVIVTATLQDLQAATGKAHTGGGTLLPMADLIRMATHANHYLALFDGVTELPLWLGRTRRTASVGTTDRAARPGTRMQFPGLRHARLPDPGPPRHLRLGQRRPDQHRRPHLRLPLPPQTRHHQRLDHPQERLRPHRMDPPTPTRNYPAAPTTTTTPSDTSNHPTTATRRKAQAKARADHPERQQRWALAQVSSTSVMRACTSPRPPTSRPNRFIRTSRTWEALSRRTWSLGPPV